jgi:hypothetical protein
MKETQFVGEYVAIDRFLLCRTLQRAGYKPHAYITLHGRRLELISYPFPDHRNGIGCMVREPHAPETMFEWTIPEHVLKAAVESFG